MIDDDMFDARTYGLLAEFDSLGFVPTTLTPDPEKTAKEWKENIVAVITELYEMNDCLNKRVMELEQDVIHAAEKVFYREEKVAAAWNDLKCEKEKFEVQKGMWETEHLSKIRKYKENINAAVKDFAAKLKEKYSVYDDRHIVYRIIDELLKEYEK